MSALTPFDYALGIEQGRLADAGGPDGFAFVLGSELARAWEMGDGDFAAVSQVVNVNGLDLIRIDPAFFVPAGQPTGTRWRLAVHLDGTEVAGVYGWVGAERRPDDLAIPVRRLTGEHTVEIRLSLEVD